MNIIQLQDRLKGLPDQALVKYVEQPMGEVPIYLALGELQRRKEMKERFQATQADKPSVAEQLVAEVKPMQMGLGAMAPQQMMPEGQGVGAPQPAPEIDPRQMAASGIAANPQSAVGGTAMMKEGGIVGYQKGGLFSEEDEEELISKDGIIIPNTGEPIEVEEQDSLDTIFSNNNLINSYEPFPETLGDVPYMMKADTVEEYKEKLDKNKKLFGLDPNFYNNEQERLKEERLGYKTDRDQAINMGLIQAGLGIAGGTSSNPLENIAAGALPALTDTTKSLKDIKKEQRLLDKEASALNRASRAETLGDLTQFTTYKQNVENNQLKQLGLYYDYMAKQLTADSTKGTAESSLRLKIFAEARQKMETKYGKDSLLTKFAGDKQQFNTELLNEFRAIYKATTGTTFTGELPSVEILGGYDDKDSKGMVLKPNVVSKPSATGETEYFKKLPNGNIVKISEEDAFTKKK